MAHGALEVEELPDPNLQVGVLLALLQDDAKNQSSYLTWGEGAAQAGAVLGGLSRQLVANAGGSRLISPRVLPDRSILEA